MSAKPTIYSLHKLLTGVKVELKTKVSSAEIDALLKEIKDKDEKINLLTSRVEVLEGGVSLLKRTCVLLEGKCDDNEQYSRRTSLRINGIEVQEDDDGDSCVQSVESILGGIPGVVLPENSIERAHRVGKPRTGEDGKKNQQMIVKLKSRNVRTDIYKKRKGQQSVKVYLDLTMRRLNLKKLAVEKTNNCEHVAFVFANIYCRLTVG